ncbi:MAG TPA: hypothetical protein VFY86_04200 [Nocardioides sp.]|nr:hypothetical protein [Nocardioides sp.]
MDRTVEVPFLTAAAVPRRRSEAAGLDEVFAEASGEALAEASDEASDEAGGVDEDAGVEVDVDVEVLVASPDVSGFGLSSPTGPPPGICLAR